MEGKKQISMNHQNGFSWLVVGFPVSSWNGQNYTGICEFLPGRNRPWVICGAREREEEEGKNGEDRKDDETLNLEKDVQGA